MKSCFFSAMFLLSLLFFVGGASGQEQVSVFQPAEQTSGDFTLTLKKAAWCHSWEVGAPEEYRLCQDSAGLGLWYDLTSSRSNLGLSPEKRIGDFMQSIQLFPKTPSGPTTKFELFPQDKTAWNGEVDPRTKKADVEFEFLDPAAPSDARGEWTHSLDFSNLPIPQDETLVPVQRALTTPRGTRVVMEKVARRNSLLVLVMRLFPSVKVPDMKAQFFGAPATYGYEAELPTLTDNTGRKIKALTLSQFDVLEKPDDRRPDWEWPLTLSMALPESDAKSFNVSLKVKESAASLKQWQWFHRFRFTLPTASIPHIWRATQWTGRDAAVVETPELEATLEPIKPDYGNWQLRFWWRNRKKPDFPDQTWRLTKLLRADDGKPALGFPLEDGEWAPEDGSVTPDDLLWHLDGTAPADDERGESIIVSSRKLRLPIRLRAEVEPIRFRQSAINFQDLAIPAPDQSLPLNLEEVTPMGTKIILQRVHHVVTRNPIPGLSEYELNSLWTNRHAGFLFFSVDVQGPKNREVEVEFGGIRDELGHERDAHFSGMGYEGRRFFSIPFPRKAEKLDFQLIIKEVQPLGRHQTIIFPEVAPPQP